MKKIIEELGEIIEGGILSEEKEDDVGDDLDEISKMLDEEKEEGEASDTENVIRVLSDTDYREKDAYFKMVQLLKGLAVSSEEDEMAKKYLSAVSDALTDAAKSVLGEDVIDEGYKDSEIRRLKKEEIWRAQVHDDSGNRTKWLNVDKEFMDALNKAWRSKKQK